jgi:hypothetical protein
VPIGWLDLLIDGVRRDSISPGNAFEVDTTRLADGYHDLRVIAYEASDVRTQGRWTGSMVVDNHGRRVETTVAPSTGDLSTVFTVAAAVNGGEASELRLMHNGRVIAAQAGGEASFEVPGRVLGAGEVEITVVAEFTDGRSAFSAPVGLTVAFDESGDGPSGEPDLKAFSYTAYVSPGHPTLIDLPAVDSGGHEFAIEITDGPRLATIDSDGSAHMLRPHEGAFGADSLTFRAVTGTVTSAPAEVRIRYCEDPVITDDPVRCRWRIWLPFADAGTR